MAHLLLAIDNESLPLRRNLCLHITRPRVRPEPVLTPSRDDPDAPDNAAAHFYGAVIHEAGRYRMWYYACHWDRGGGPAGVPLLGDLREGPVCYAESGDGVHWIRPGLGQVEWRGRRDNNIIRLDAAVNEGVHVIRDDEDPDAGRRYKMVYNDWVPERGFWTVRTATSPDGLAWTDGPRLPFDGFLEQASLYRFRGLYYIAGQMLLAGEGGHASGRQGFAVVSPDFEHWLQEYGESFLLPEPSDPAARGCDKPYEQVHIGVGAASFGNVCVGLYGLWHNRPRLEDKDWFGFGATSGDFGLVISNDGLHFREPVKGHVWLHRDESPCAALPPGVAHGRILCQGNGILNVGDRTLIYHGRWANTADVKDYYAEVALATLPRDRWGALGLFPQAADGSVWTVPLTLPRGAQVSLNADGAGGMRVEVADERFALLPAFSGDRAGRLAAPDGLECRVSWPGPDLAALAGQTVRLRVRLARGGHAEPRLYAINAGI